MNYSDDNSVDMKAVKKSLSEKEAKKEYYSTISDASSSVNDDGTCSCGRSSVLSSSPSVSRSGSPSGSPSNSESESGKSFLPFYNYRINKLSIIIDFQPNLFTVYFCV